LSQFYLELYLFDVNSKQISSKTIAKNLNEMKNLMLISAVFLFLLFLRMPSQAEENQSLKGKYIIVLDIQDIYTKEMMNVDSAKNLIEAVNKVIEISESDKVIYIESIEAMLELSLTGLSVQFKPGLNLDDRLKIVSENKFAKNEPSAFTSERLVRFVKERNARDFVVVGLMAEHCVLETLLAGNRLGYNMYMIPGAIAGESDDSKTTALEKALKNGIKTIEFSNLPINN
jgi:nicotinamidase-related amidase